MNFQQIVENLKSYLQSGKKIFTSSSFQTHSLPLLHMLSRMTFRIPVYFLDTGFHFPETLKFRDEVADLFDIELTNLRSEIPKIQQRNRSARFLFTSDPDFCCNLNKVLPLDPILASHDVWIAGVRRDQSSVRQEMSTEQPSKFGCMRFHPILDWTNRDIEKYIKEFNLPRHPLEELGYLSVGCEPCSRKFDFELAADERLGRWFGMNKTECGLHTDLLKNAEN